MNREFRIKAIEKIAAQNGILTDLVSKSLGVSPQKEVEKHQFKLLGNVGPGTTLSASNVAVKEDGTVDAIIMIRGLLPSKIKGRNYKPWQYSPEDLGFNGAVITAEAGGKGSAENLAAFGHASWYNQAVDNLLAKLQKQYPDKQLKIGNVTLASFSGGGDAVASLLSQRDKLKYPIKNVIGIDTFHISNKNGPRFKAVRDFMEEARKDPSKRIHIVHTAVPTGGYASTTETADALINDLGLKRKQYEGEWTGYGPKPVSQINEGGLTVTQLFDKQQPYMARDPITGKVRPNVLGETSGGQHLASLIWLPNAIRDALENSNKKRNEG